MNYFAIDKYESIEIEDAFCDENGKLNNELPVSKGHITCTKTENGTRVEFKMIYPTETDLEKNGNEGGFNKDARGDYALKAFHSADLSLRVLTAILKN